MGIIKTKGIVTKIANSSDSDKVLTVLTGDRGKIQVFCKGAKKLKSAFLASAEFLTFSNMILFESSNNSNLYTLTSAEPVYVFYNLRLDIDKLICASNMAQIMNDVCQEEEITEKRLQLLLNSLYVLSETEKDMRLIYSIFKIRLLGILGFIPRLNKCVNCNKELSKMDNIYFSIKHNGIKCEECKKQDNGAIHISETAYTSIIYILSADPKKIFSFDVPEKVIDELELVSKVYLNDKLEKEYL